MDIDPQTVAQPTGETHIAPVQSQALAQEGDLAMLISAQNKRYLIRLEAGGKLETHRGIINYEHLIGQCYGTRVQSHIGSTYLLLQPSLADVLIETKRNTQIMYPKEIGYLLVMMDIGPGRKVLEAGTGSGSLTTALAFAVGPQGHVYSYDYRVQMQNLARKNLQRVGLHERATFKERNIEQGFDETGLDAVFLDVPNPYDYIDQARAALKTGGFFGSILPTTNQVSRLLIALKRGNFGFIEVCEIMLRHYKSAPERFRPVDRMVAHTGFLIFARSFVDPVDDSEVPLGRDWEKTEPETLTEDSAPAEA